MWLWSLPFHNLEIYPLPSLYSLFSSPSRTLHRLSPLYWNCFSPQSSGKTAISRKFPGLSSFTHHLIRIQSPLCRRIVLYAMSPRTHCNYELTSELAEGWNEFLSKRLGYREKRKIFWFEMVFYIRCFTPSRDGVKDFPLLTFPCWFAGLAKIVKIWILQTFSTNLWPVLFLMFFVEPRTLILMSPILLIFFFWLMVYTLGDLRNFFSSWNHKDFSYLVNCIAFIIYT